MSTGRQALASEGKTLRWWPSSPVSPRWLANDWPPKDDVMGARLFAVGESPLIGGLSLARPSMCSCWLDGGMIEFLSAVSFCAGLQVLWLSVLIAETRVRWTKREFSAAVVFSKAFSSHPGFSWALIELYLACCLLR